MVTNEIINLLKQTIQTELNLLKSKQNISKDEYVQNIELQHIVERAFHQAIQACIDIGARIISLKNLRPPRSYHEIFDILSGENVIPKELSIKMKKLVGFRNILVHEYHKIKHEEVYRHLQESLGIIKEFIESITK